MSTLQEFQAQLQRLAAGAPQVKASAERAMRETHMLQRRHPKGRASRRLTVDPRITMAAGKQAGIAEINRLST